VPVEVQIVQQAYRFALAPTPRQARAFASHAGGARFAYNWGLDRIAEALDTREAEKATGKATTKVPGHFDLCKAWTAWKDEHADDPEPEPGQRRTNTAWVGENFVGTYQAALRDAAVAWKNFFDSRTGKRRGRAMGRPRYKSRHRSKLAFQVHGSTLQVTDTRHVKLPKIGEVRTHESTRKLLRRIRKGLVACPECSGTAKVRKGDELVACKPCKGSGAVAAARIVRGTVSLDSSGRWYIALTVEIAREVRTSPSRRQREGGPVGVDFGVREIATLSTGEQITNPRYLEGALGKLARAQRAYARTQKGSKGRERARRRVARCHAKVRHQRLDALHKATSLLIHGHDKIVVEGWDVAEVMASGRKQKLPGKVRRDRNRALADAGIGIGRWQLESKARWYGATVVATDRHAPTGRTCSACGQVSAKPVPPHQELWECPSCGHRLARRMNTARVLAGVAVSVDAPSGGESLNGRGGDVRPAASRRSGRSPGKRQASTRERSRGETGAPGP